MLTHAYKTDLSGRRCSIGAAVLHVPVIVFDRDGTEVGRFRSPRKLAERSLAALCCCWTATL